MNEPDVIEPTVAEPMPSRPTKRDLIERGLDVVNAGSAKISINAGGVQFATVAEVFDVAKAMATAGVHVPKYLRGNPGGCLGIIFQAIEWRMSPFQVANKSYEVNDRVAYESQLIHAVVEARAPLRNRLDCRYDGEGPTRTCTIIGTFRNGDTREYTTPEFAKIRVKNSPLWNDDRDQQLFYYASRSWARKWVPDVLMGIYAKEELQDQPSLGRDETPVGLHARLTGSERSEEGHREGHTTSELDRIAGKGQMIEHKPRTSEESHPAALPDGGEDVGAMETPPEPSKRTRGRPRGSGKGQKAEKEQEAIAAQSRLEQYTADLALGIKTPKQYVAYAKDWIADTADNVELGQRWNAERTLRNKIGMVADETEQLQLMISKKLSR